MEKRRIHRIEYFQPGSYYPDHTHAELEERSIAEALKKAPSNAYAFRFYDALVDEHTDPFDAKNRMPRTFGNPAVLVDLSPVHYIGAKVISREEVEKMPWEGVMGSRENLLTVMKMNGWTSVLRGRFGNWQAPPSENEVLVPEPDTEN